MDKTLDMAREAGFTDFDEPNRLTEVQMILAFEALVRADERDRAMRENAYVQAEREACAKVCEELFMWNEDDPGSSAAKAIRARGQA
jgi:hypothetical protein